MCPERHLVSRRRRSARIVICSAAVLVGVGTAIVATHEFPGSSDALRGHKSVSPSTTLTTSAPPISASTTTTLPPPEPVWRIAWGSAMAWGDGTASNVTVRELATIAVGGKAVRVRISNVFGNAPMEIGAASVALDAGGAAVQAATVRSLVFGSEPETTVPAGGSASSNPTPMTVTGGETLAISLYVANSDLVSVHPCCNTQRDVSYFTLNGGGNLTASASPGGFSIASPYPRWVDAVDVLQTTGKGSIVVVGDSITDGYNATQRWTDILQERIDGLPVSRGAP